MEQYDPYYQTQCSGRRLGYQMFTYIECIYVIGRTVSATSKKNDGGSGSPDTQMNWLMFELLWRDFFR